MEPKTIKIDGLEENAVVTIYNSTTKGEIPVKGRVGNTIVPPWVVYMVTAEFDLGIHSATLEDPYPFIGSVSGIIKIEKGGSIIYENSKIPIPYETFDVYTEEGQNALNSLLKDSFGDDFYYTFETEKYIMESNRKRRQEHLDDWVRRLNDMKGHGFSLETRMDVIEKTKNAGYLTPKEAEFIIGKLDK